MSLSIVDLSEIEDTDCDKCNAFQLANLALRGDVKKLVEMLLSVEFVAYQPKEIREFIEKLKEQPEEES